MSTGTAASSKLRPRYFRGAAKQPRFSTPTPTLKLERINNMANNYGNGGGYPSTNSNPSGGGRSNGPRGK